MVRKTGSSWRDSLQVLCRIVRYFAHQQMFETKETSANEAQTIIDGRACQGKCAGFVDNPQVKRRRWNSPIQTPKKKSQRQILIEGKWGQTSNAKPIVSKPEIITYFISISIDVVGMVDFCRTIETTLMTLPIKSH